MYFKHRSVSMLRQLSRGPLARSLRPLSTLVANSTLPESKVKLLINGELLESSTEHFIPNLDPVLLTYASLEYPFSRQHKTSFHMFH